MIAVTTIAVLLAGTRVKSGSASVGWAVREGGVRKELFLLLPNAKRKQSVAQPWARCRAVPLNASK